MNIIIAGFNKDITDYLVSRLTFGKKSNVYFPEKFIRYDSMVCHIRNDETDRCLEIGLGKA